jgi:cytosine permease
MNAYSGSLAVSVLLRIEEKRFKLTAAAAGITGTVLGAAGILSLLSGFLSLLSSLVPPVAGVIIAAYLGRIPRGRRAGAAEIPGGFALRPGFHLPGLIAYGLGAFAAWLTGGAFPFFIPPLNGIIVAMAVYMVLERFFPGPKGKGVVS